ncbi:hypothetical protein KRR38_33680 [Novosphingobium sp. G106]|uniref:hypothetical protein n=1 Tax=Novosphingobium sp. G106 TaxID=2849500 RepID=UPI001C2D9CD9|nr:hypothetical protein [Novosphingobium sp. G106]MBV1692186.1 hypothetical protein [Novosphingobium sp. G106]MBV1692456.1 hypothetical protein [Novosphingobium sp. G106]
MNATNMGVPIVHAFDAQAWLTDFAALGGGYDVGDNSLGLALIIGNQTDAELALGQMMITSLTANEKTALFRHLRTTIANAGGGNN